MTPNQWFYDVYVVPTVCRSSYLDLLLFHGLRKPHLLPAGDAWNHNGSTSAGNRNWESINPCLYQNRHPKHISYIIYLIYIYIYTCIYIYISCIMSLYIYIQIYREIDRYVNDVCVFVFSHICISMLNP